MHRKHDAVPYSETKKFEVINILYMFSDYSTPKTMEYVVNMISNHTSTIKKALDQGENKNYVYRVVIYSTISKERFDRNIGIILSSLESTDSILVDNDASSSQSKDDLDSAEGDTTTEQQLRNDHTSYSQSTVSQTTDEPK